MIKSFPLLCMTLTVSKGSVNDYILDTRCQTLEEQLCENGEDSLCTSSSDNCSYVCENDTRANCKYIRERKYCMNSK